MKTKIELAGSMVLVAMIAATACDDLKPIGSTAKPAAGTEAERPDQPGPVSAIYLTDRRCRRCQLDGMIRNLRSRFFPGLKVRTLDYGDSAGRALFRELGLSRLPALLFEPGVERHERYPQIARWISERGRYRQLRVDAPFDPTAEICDNGKDDTGDGAVDCADDTCKEKPVCRPDIPRRLDLFVMSQCPFGVKALDAIKEILPAFAGRIDLDVHYIATRTPGGVRSLHGPAEAAEDMRQLCAKKHYRRDNKFMDYIWCRNEDYRSERWRGCARGGISAAVIERCVETEGRKLLEADIRIAEELEISASPTWLANNRHKLTGIAPEPVKNAFCRHNRGLAGCEKKLSGAAAPPAGACGR
jgi:hypothetical protein